MIVLLADNQPDCLFAWDRRADCPQPTTIPVPDGIVKLDRQQLQDAGCNASEVNKSLNSVYGLHYQHPGICIKTAGQIALGTVSDLGPDTGPEMIGKGSNQMF